MKKIFSVLIDTQKTFDDIYQELVVMLDVDGVYVDNELGISYEFSKFKFLILLTKNEFENDLDEDLENYTFDTTIYGYRPKLELREQVDRQQLALAYDIFNGLKNHGNRLLLIENAELVRDRINHKNPQ